MEYSNTTNIYRVVTAKTNQRKNPYNRIFTNTKDKFHNFEHSFSTKNLRIKRTWAIWDYHFNNKKSSTYNHLMRNQNRYWSLGRWLCQVKGKIMKSMIFLKKIANSPIRIKDYLNRYRVSRIKMKGWSKILKSIKKSMIKRHKN